MNVSLHRIGYVQVSHWHVELCQCKPPGWIVLACFCLCGTVQLHGVTFSLASSDQRIYVGGPGTVTLSSIKAALPHASLCLIDATNQVWFLGAALEITNGATLLLHGAAAGGDVNKLLLKSDDSAVSNNVSWLNADWGTVDINGVKIESWNRLAAAPNMDFTNFGRAFIRVRSRLVGTNVQQSALNVANSEIGWLGANSGDRLGLDWEVDGSAPGVSVFGVVSNCYIHDCQLGVAGWFGSNSFGNDVTWTRNVIATNTLFGFDPTDAAEKSVMAVNTVFSNSYAPVFRWSASDRRIYVMGLGNATLSMISNALPTAPLVLMDPTNLIWYLGANLYVVNGTRLKLYGPAIGGDVAELRLKSESSAETNAFVEMRADWGWLDIQNTKITSWDDFLKGPNVITNFGRAFIHVRSTLDPDGVTAHESRMDVINSDIGYLGVHAKEAYGLVWKVVNTTATNIPPGSTNTLYDLVKVYGNIINSRVHDNFFGVYTYGLMGGIWTSNEVDHNLAYGFDPHNYSVNLDIENNNVHDNGWHGIIASIGCANGILRNNLSWNNGLDPLGGRGNGIMLHRSSSNWLVENNQSYDNRDSGIAIFASNGNVITNNFCENNDNAGIRMSVGAAGNIVTGNEFDLNGGAGFLLFTGTNNPAPDELSGRCQENVFTNNFIYGYGLAGVTSEAIMAEDCDSNLFTSNTFTELVSSTNPMVQFQTCTNNLMSGNILPSDGFVQLAGSMQTIGTNKFKLHTYSTFVSQTPVTLQLDSSSTAVFTNQNGAIFACGQVNIATSVNSTGSIAVLTSSLLGTGTNTIVTQNLFAQVAPPSTNNAQITVVVWDLNGDYKVWTVKGSSATAPINFRVGDCHSGVSYSVTRGSAVVATVTADSQGYLTFITAPGSTAQVTYTVSPNSSRAATLTTMTTH